MPPVLSIVTEPANEPVTWAQAQKQLGLEGLDDDKDHVTKVLVPAARDRGELATRRAWMPQTWQFILDAFPCDWDFIELPKPPLIEVVSVSYFDTNGDRQTLVEDTDYIVQAPAGPRCARGRIALPSGGTWPATFDQLGAVTIEFRCGYEDAADADAVAVPPLLISALLMDVGRLYEHRESLVMTPGVTAAIEVPRASTDIYRSFRSLARQRL